MRKSRCAAQDAEKFIGNARHTALTLEAAREAIVLLKNEKHLLPLAPKYKKIAIIGPNAAEGQLGGYCIDKPTKKIGPLAGLRRIAPKGTKILHAEGCPIYTPDRSKIAEAVRVAKEADVVIAAVGEISSTTRDGEAFGGQGYVVGETFDRTKLGLPGVQEELVKALLETGKPVIVLLVNGRPLAIEEIAAKAPAIIEAWFAGEKGGLAIAEIIFGEVNPSGKLPVTFPRSVGHIPVFYNHKKSARGIYHQPGSVEKSGRDYVDAPPTPLFEFGYGLSYTKFRYSNLRITPGRFARRATWRSRWMWPTWVSAGQGSGAAVCAG